MARTQASLEKEQTSDFEGSHSDVQAVDIFSFENESNEAKLSRDQVAEGSPLKNSRNHEKKEKKKSKIKRRRPNVNEDNKEEDNKNSRETEGNEDLNQYLPLYGAALEGDWESAMKFIKGNPSAATAKITDRSETALHVAVTGGKAMKFVKELVKNYPDSLEKVDKMKNTALFYAAAVGNTEVAKFLVRQNSNLTQKRGYYGGYTPLHIAAKNGHKDTVDYLLSETKEEHPSPFEGESGFFLLKNLITASFNGIASDLLKLHPNLAQNKRLQTFVLPTLAQKPAVFESGSQLGYWQRLIYQWIPVEKHNLTAYSKAGDIENSIDRPKDCSAPFKNTFGIMRGKVCVMFWNTIKFLVPSINDIYQTKITHVGSLELVKLMFKEMTLNQETARDFLEEPLFRAVELGIPELVREITKAYPPSVSFLDNENRNIFQLAVLHRQEKVFSLIYQMGLYKHFMGNYKDYQGNNILHLAGQLKPSSRISGPALQMQQELQWFKAVESLVQPSFQEQKTPGKLLTKEEKTKSSKKTTEEKPKSSKKTTQEKTKSSKKTTEEKTSSKKTEEGKTKSSKKPKEEKTKSSKHSEGLTPRQLFTEEHAELVKEGKEWMNSIASSCTTAAALIVTMVFAAAFTPPGGNNSEGKPIFLRAPSFIIFAISDALALFLSATSVLIFLGILTSRYSEEDFLKSLPKKLIFALITFFISIVSMMVAFGAALHMLLVDISTLFIIPIALLACLPVILFAWLQFPLLRDVIRSTYGSGILRAVK